jgi:hypothetical protein
MGNLFGRNIELFISDKKYTNKDFDINFDVKFDDDPEPNLSAVEIYNLSQETISNIKKGSKIILNAGYQKDIGTILLGVVEEHSTAIERTDKLTRLYVGDASNKWLNTTVNKSFKTGIKASQVLRDTLQGFGLEIGEISLANDIVYTNGKVVSGMLQKVVRDIASETNSKFYIKNGIIFIRPYNKGTETGFLLNSYTGLIGSPEKIETDDGEGWKVRMLLNHRINIDSLIRIESRIVKGDFRVKKGNHAGDFITEAEVYSI